MDRLDYENERRKSYNLPYSFMSWQDFLTWCNNQGFEEAYLEDFEGDSYLSAGDHKITINLKGIEAILINTKTGMIIYAEGLCFNDEIELHKATLYCETRLKGEAVLKKNAYFVPEDDPSFEVKTEFGTIEKTYDLLSSFNTPRSILLSNYAVVPWSRKRQIRFINLLEEFELRNKFDEAKMNPDASDVEMGKEKELITENKIKKMDSKYQIILGYSETKKY